MGLIKVTGYRSGRRPCSIRAMSRSAQSHLTTAKKDGTQRYFIHYTAERNRLPCTSDVLWTVKFCKLVNQNLTIQATECEDRYLRSIVFNVIRARVFLFLDAVRELGGQTVEN